MNPLLLDLDAATERLAVALWTQGRPGDALRGFLATLPDPLPPAAAAALSSLTEALQRPDPIRAADVLLAELLPALDLAPRPTPAPSEDARPRRRSLHFAEREAEAQARMLPVRGPLLLCGAADGALVDQLVAAGRDVVLWEPTPAGAATAAARAHTTPRVTRYETEWPLPTPAAGVFFHPALDDEERTRAHRAWARCRWSAWNVTPVRPRWDRLRVAVVHRGRPFFGEAETESALTELGHDAARVDAATLIRRLERGPRPDLVFSVNGAALHQDPHLAGLLECAEIPVMCWFVDDPEVALRIPARLATSNVLALSWERQAVSRLRGWGFAARYLPHGTRLQPIVHTGRSGISWVGASYAGSDRVQLAAGAPDDAAAREISVLLRDALATDPRLPPSVAMQAVAALDGAATVLRRDADRIFLQVQAADAAAAARRQAVARALASLGLVVHGDQEGWSTLDTGATLAPPVHHDRRGEVYATSCLSVDLAHPQMPTAVTQRAFDVPACGALLLADDRPDLHEHFDVGTEVLAYGDPDSAREAATWALQRPDAAARMARAAQRRVEREHRWEHRLRTALRWGREHFGE